MAINKARRRPLLVPSARAAAASAPGNPEWRRPEAARFAARDPLSLAIELDRTVGLMANSILVRPDGQETEIEDSAAPIRGRDGTVMGAVMVFREVGAALETSRQMSRLALRDAALTGLPNRRTRPPWDRSSCRRSPSRIAWALGMPASRAASASACIPITARIPTR
jgi:hypothetical protein